MIDDFAPSFPLYFQADDADARALQEAVLTGKARLSITCDGRTFECAADVKQLARRRNVIEIRLCQRDDMRRKKRARKVPA